MLVDLRRVFRSSLGRDILVALIGAVVALLGQNFLEQQEGHARRRQAELALRAEVTDAVETAHERLLISRCLRDRIIALTRYVVEGEEDLRQLRFEQGSSSDALPTLYRPDPRTLSTDAWRNVTGTGLMQDMPDAWGRLWGLYGLIGRWNELSRDEHEAAARLTPLAFYRPSDEPSRTAMLQTLGNLDRISSSLKQESQAILAAAQNAGIELPISDLRASALENLDLQRQFRGPCVVNLPLVRGNRIVAP